QLQPFFAVVGVAQRLRGDGADTGLGPRNESADVGELRLAGDPQVTRPRVLGDDAVGVRAFGKIGWWSLVEDLEDGEEEHALFLSHLLLQLLELASGGVFARRAIDVRL